MARTRLTVTKQPLLTVNMQPAEFVRAALKEKDSNQAWFVLERRAALLQWGT